MPKHLFYREESLQQAVLDEARKLARAESKKLEIRIEELETENRILRDMRKIQPCCFMVCDSCGTTRDYYVSKSCPSCGSGKAHI